MNKEKYPVSVAVAKMERDNNKKTRKDFSGIFKNSENRRNPFVVLSPLSIHSKSVVINSDDEEEDDEDQDEEDEHPKPKSGGGKNSSNTTSSSNNMNTTVKQEEES